MPNSTLFEKLDEAVEAILSRPKLPLAAKGELEPLARIAQELRGLPRNEFKARLKADLEQEIAMTTAVESSTKTKKSAAERHQTLTPYIMHDRAVELSEFVQQAFGAEELSRNIGSAGGYHIEIRIGDAMLMFGGGGKAKIEKPNPTRLHLYVKDADAVYQQALAAGATSIYEPVDQGYGDREAGVRDLAGNEWFIATHQGASHIPEGFRTVTPGIQAKGADRAIEFLKQAFGAEDAGTYRSPEGTVVHAVMRIGDSMLELGEAHGQWQPMPTAFFLLVDDVDGIYNRALETGATSTSAPADQPYGHRMGGVLDPFGNQWFIASPLAGNGEL
jgi:PhnB protein